MHYSNVHPSICLRRKTNKRHFKMHAWIIRANSEYLQSSVMHSTTHWRNFSFVLLHLPFLVTNSSINSMSKIAQLIDSLIRNNYASICLYIPLYIECLSISSLFKQWDVSERIYEQNVSLFMCDWHERRTVWERWTVIGIYHDFYRSIVLSEAQLIFWPQSVSDF